MAISRHVIGPFIFWTATTAAALSQSTTREWVVQEVLHAGDFAPLDYDVQWGMPLVQPDVDSDGLGNFSITYYFVDPTGWQYLPGILLSSGITNTSSVKWAGPRGPFGGSGDVVLASPFGPRLTVDWNQSTLNYFHSIWSINKQVWLGDVHQPSNPVQPEINETYRLYRCGDVNFDGYDDFFFKPHSMEQPVPTVSWMVPLSLSYGNTASQTT